MVHILNKVINPFILYCTVFNACYLLSAGYIDMPDWLIELAILCKSLVTSTSSTWLVGRKPHNIPYSQKLFPKLLLLLSMYQ